MTNLVAYYLVAMPLAILFAFKLKLYTKACLLLAGDHRPHQVVKDRGVHAGGVGQLHRLVYVKKNAAEAPLLLGNDANRTSGGRGARPIVTDQLCAKGEFPPQALAPFQCCPPTTSASDPINFTFPDPAEPLRTRRAVHVVGAEYMAKYARAVELMKALPESDPRSFYQQANVHCAYCTGAHRQLGYPELGIQIHFSWLFFPFHRAYLYFFERIAAKLLGALPSLFMEQPYRAGDPARPGAGTVELAPHNTMHTWAGDNSRPNVENMGVYYSAGRDPLFYPHHGNIDRLWESWRGIATGNRTMENFYF
ncbi:unnamed protein product [Miscanthus lutarioriparius]|uniref:Tyrosinase copper-binding domain-containing protein n=1 Tax=Miscanthus lutarioriparius TaxID=422564 RepID=A0A811NRK6_9POAL|nr:unnamed protein product [Miscanthus lutarioriparius]